MDSIELARKWLLEHGYAQWPDGEWNYQGYEADALDILSSYIAEQQSK